MVDGERDKRIVNPRYLPTACLPARARTNKATCQNNLPFHSNNQTQKRRSTELSKSTRARQPGQTGEGINEEELKHERLRILMSYDNRKDIHSPTLAEGWKVSPQMIGGGS
jgi:hypothetical protein